MDSQQRLTSCKHCMAPVAWSARVCPACGGSGPVASQAGGGKVIAGIVLGVAAVLAYGLWERSERNSRAQEKRPVRRDVVSDAMRESALSALRRDNPSALRIAWADDRILWVWIADDGTSRDGLARYYCEALAQHRVRGVTVRIIDAASVRSSPQTIGRAQCRS